MPSSNTLHEPGITHGLLVGQVGELRHVDTGRTCREGCEGVTLSHFRGNCLVIWISFSRETLLELNFRANLAAIASPFKSYVRREAGDVKPSTVNRCFPGRNNYAKKKTLVLIKYRVNKH